MKITGIEGLKLKAYRTEYRPPVTFNQTFHGRVETILNVLKYQSLWGPCSWIQTFKTFTLSHHLHSAHPFWCKFFFSAALYPVITYNLIFPKQFKWLPQNYFRQLCHMCCGVSVCHDRFQYIEAVNSLAGGVSADTHIRMDLSALTDYNLQVHGH